MNKFLLPAFVLLAGTSSTLAQNNMSARPAQSSGMDNPLVAAIASQAGGSGVLDLRTNNGQQQVEIIIGPVPGEVQVQGIDTLGITTFTGITCINVIASPQFDFIGFRILSEVVPDINVNTGTGESDVIFSYEFPYSATPTVSNVTVTGGGSADKVAFNVLNATSSFVANWNVNHFGGSNEIIASVNSSEASDLLSLNLNAVTAGGQDKFELFALSAAATLNVSVTGNLGAGVDSAIVSIDGLGPATTTANYSFDLGSGNDVAETLIVSRGGSATMTGNLMGGTGLDALKLFLEGDGRVDLQMTGGDGADLLDMALKGLIEGSPRLIAGNGNDELKIVVDGPQIATPFLDGGAGFDKAFGFGTIVNCEDVSR